MSNESIATIGGLVAVVVIVALVVFVLLPSDWKTFEEFDVSQVGSMLATLGVIALFLERSLEVFISIWREKGKAELLESSEKTKEDYRANTQRIAMLVSFSASCLISAVGVRTLQPLVGSDTLSGMGERQTDWFHFVDVFLTAGLLAGGSEGIHKLTQVYTTFMEASAIRAEGASQQTTNPNTQ